MSVGKLRKMTEELEKISVEASEVLTHALLMREKEGQDKETYNGMISVSLSFYLSIAVPVVRRG